MNDQNNFGTGVISDVVSMFGDPVRKRHQTANDLAGDLEQLDPWIRAARHMSDAQAALRLAATAGPTQVADDIREVSKRLDEAVADTREQIGAARAAALGWQFRCSLRPNDPCSYRYLALFEAFTAHVAGLGLTDPANALFGYATLCRYSGVGGQIVEVLFLDGFDKAWIADDRAVSRVDATGPEDALARYSRDLSCR